MALIMSDAFKKEKPAAAEFQKKTDQDAVCVFQSHVRGALARKNYRLAKAIEDFKIPGKDLFDSFLEHKLQKAEASKEGGYNPYKIKDAHDQGVRDNPYGFAIILSKKIQIKSGLLLGDIQDFLFKTHFPGLTKKHKEVRSRKVKGGRPSLVLVPGCVPERLSVGKSSKRCLSVLRQVYASLPPSYRELHEQLLSTIDVSGEDITGKTYNLMDLHVSHIIGREAISRRVDDMVSFIKAGIDRPLTDAIGMGLCKKEDFRSLFADEMANFYNETITILQGAAKGKALKDRLKAVKEMKENFNPATGDPFVKNIKDMVIRCGGNFRVAPKNDSGDELDGTVPQLNYDNSGKASTPRSTAIKTSWDVASMSSGEISVFSEFFGFLRVIADNKKNGYEVETTTTSPVWNRLVCSLNRAFVSISNLGIDDYREIARQYTFSLLGIDPNSLGCLAPSSYKEQSVLKQDKLDFSDFGKLASKIEHPVCAVKRRLTEVLSLLVSKRGIGVLPSGIDGLGEFSNNLDAHLKKTTKSPEDKVLPGHIDLLELRKVQVFWGGAAKLKDINKLGYINKALFYKLVPVISRFISDQIKKQERSNLGLVLGASGGCLTTLRDSRECLTPMSESRPDDDSHVSIAGI